MLHASAEPVSSLWAHMTVDSLDNATKALAKRESIPIKNAEKDIGCWSSGCEDPPNIIDLGSWASERGIDHVIWTALGPKFADKPGDAPTEDQAIEYLNNLSGDHRSRAEKYVRCAPQQICTAYRLRIERCLGWTPVIRKKNKTGQKQPSMAGQKRAINAGSTGPQKGRSCIDGLLRGSPSREPNASFPSGASE